MDFLSFVSLAKDIMMDFSYSRLERAKINQNTTSISEFKEKDLGLARLASLRNCYGALFPEKEEGIFSSSSSDSSPFFTNDFFLDWVTPTHHYKNSPSIVVQSGRNYYNFLPEELWMIFHNDLSRSNAEMEPRYRICSLTFTFRLPHNPYSNLVFTAGEMKQIISQFITKKVVIPEESQMPEVFIFLLHFEEMMKNCQLLEKNYDKTGYLQNFFQKKGLRFLEKTKIRTSTFCENYSVWVKDSLLVKKKKKKRGQHFSNDTFYCLLLGILEENDKNDLKKG